jgi:hypothetical protein
MSTPSQSGPALSTLAVFVDGEWTGHDFAVFFLAIDKLYAAIELTGRVARESKPSLSVIRSHKENRPSVVSIAYSSPGGINLEGSGEPIDALRRLLKDIAGGHFQDLKAKGIDIAEQEESHRHQKHANKIDEIRSQLQVIDEMATLMRKHGYSEDDVRGFVRRGFLEPSAVLLQLCQQGKLTGVGKPNALPPAVDLQP